MALIRIHADGTFETAHVEATAATSVELKANITALKKDLSIIDKIVKLRATRERIQQERLRNSHKSGPAAAIAHTKRVAKINDAIKTLTGTISGGKFIKPELIRTRINTATERYEKARAAAKAPKLTRGNKTGDPRRNPQRLKTVRAPKDHGAAFDRGAKKIAGTVTRGIRSELRDHGKTALVPVSNKPGAKAPVAKPSGKAADTATKHATKPSRGAIGNTLAEIKAVKARIATGELKGAKLIRAREELEKQREALRGLRAGKSPANQRAIVKPGAAKHMGGAKKIVGKPSGMGDAAAKGKTVATLTKRLTALRDQRTAAQTAGNKTKSAQLLSQIKIIKGQLAALKKR